MMMKLRRIMIIAAVLAAAFAITSFADGWTQDEKGWKFLKGGYPVYNQWELDSNGDYFYLDYNGYMAVNSFVDSDRYVDATGRMVKSAWRQIDNNWYYFEANGRMVQGKKKQIEGLWYFFDDMGVMVTGWYNDGNDWYYCDENSGGHMAVNTWKKLEPAPEMDGQYEDGDGTFWFYFHTTGKAARATDGEYKEVSIGGNRYAFDSCGRMQTGWVKLSDTDPAIAGYKYYNDEQSLGSFGAVHTGWLSAYVPEEIDNSGEVQWYYFSSNGTPAYGKENDSAIEASLKKITKNGTTYSYLFNSKGNPVYGLRKVVTSAGEETSMYFGTKNQSCLQKATTVVEGDGTTWKYAFNGNGYGITGVKNGYLYYQGKLQKAVDDTFAYYTVGGDTWLVNSAGAVIKNYNRTKKSEDVEYKSDANGKRDGGMASVSAIIEPVWQTDEY